MMPREDALRAALEAQRRDFLAMHDQSLIDAAEFGPRSGANGRWKARAEGIDAALEILDALANPEPPEPSVSVEAALTRATAKGTTIDIDEWNRPLYVRASVTPPPLDAERLYDAHTEVEAAYIQQPDRHAKAYWRKVAHAYDHPGFHAAQAARLSEAHDAD